MTPAPQLSRRLSLWDAASLVIGGVIGSAIFLVPATLARIHPSPWTAICVVLFAGVLSYFGALAYAELGAMMPETGGEYVFLREAWGPAAGFLCAWTHFVVIQSGGIAAIAVGFADLLPGAVPFDARYRTLVAVGAIALLTLLNYYGVRAGTRAGNLLSVSKVAGLLIMIAAVAGQPGGETAWSWPRDWTLAQFARALVPALWAFEGWNLLTFVAGEIRKPERNIPLALAAGLGCVIVVYCASFWVFYATLPAAEIAASDRVAADAAQRALGPVGGKLVTLTMLVALTGSLNACILAAPRVYYAVSRDQLGPSLLGRLSPRYGTPAYALLAQMLWCCALAWSGSYETLFSYCTFGAWIFYCAAVGAVLVLRRRRPDAPRPYRMWGYPWTALAFLTVAGAFVLSTLWQSPAPSATGLLLIAAGLAPYVFVRRRYGLAVGRS